jgi:Flp pilus assembly protein TadG
LGQAGSVAIQTALLLTVMIGFAALAVEVSDLLLQHRRQQAATDSAAMAAAMALGSGADPTAEARAVTADLGLEHGAGGVSVSVANPPASGAHAGDASYVQVTVQHATTPTLASIVNAGGFNIKTQATAVRGAGGSACILVLDGSASGALTLSNSGRISTPGCGVAVNSSSNSAVKLSGASKIDGTASVVGDVAFSGSATITGDLTKNAAPVADPYAGVELPARPSQPLTAPAKPTSPLQAGWYPNGLAFANDVQVSLEPGVYWVGSQFSVAGAARVTGTGVTLVFYENFTPNISNAGVLRITAPTTGPTAGIAIYSSPSNTAQFGTVGAGVLDITGAMYFPNQPVVFSNSGIAGSSACSQLIAKRLQITGAGSIVLKNGCSGVGVSAIGGSGAASLVE